MAKKNNQAEPERDPAEPIGMPPGGGRWTWDIPNQKWVDLDKAPQVQEKEVVTESN